MLITLLILQTLTLLALLVLLLRKPATSSDAADPRLAQLLSADLPTQMTRLDARSEGLDAHLAQRGRTTARRNRDPRCRTAYRNRRQPHDPQLHSYDRPR